MIDLHTHILPGLDDGAANMDQALALLDQAARTGTRELVLTPHCAPAYGFFNFGGMEMEEQFQTLCQAAGRAGIPLVLHRGMEVLYRGREEFSRYARDYFPLAGSRYLLLEFPFDAAGPAVLEGTEVAADYGFVPVLAHPERYPGVGPDTLERCRAMGARLQLNKGSLSGVHGPGPLQRAGKLLELDWADFVASDAHHPRLRNSRLDRVYGYLRKTFGQARAERLLVENPRRVLRNQAIPLNG